MIDIVVTNSNGLTLGREDITGSLWRMRKDGVLENVNRLDIGAVNVGLTKHIGLWRDNGILCIDGGLKTDYLLFKDDTLALEAGRCLLDLHPRQSARPPQPDCYTIYSMG